MPIIKVCVNQSLSWQFPECEHWCPGITLAEIPYHWGLCASGSQQHPGLTCFRAFFIYPPCSSLSCHFQSWTCDTRQEHRELVLKALNTNYAKTFISSTYILCYFNADSLQCWKVFGKAAMAELYQLSLTKRWGIGDHDMALLHSLFWQNCMVE